MIIKQNKLQMTQLELCDQHRRYVLCWTGAHDLRLKWGEFQEQ
jgi:hypothetical protein